MTRPTLIITRGLPASGKTTWAKAWVEDARHRSVRVNRDALREMIHFTRQNVPHATEQHITRVSHDLVRGYLKDGMNVVVDDTNLRQRFARQWATIAHEAGAEFAVRDFTDVPLETCLERNAGRPEKERVPEHVIRTMHQKFLNAGPLPHPEPDLDKAEAWVPYDNPKHLPHVYLVDIDGTIAIKGDRDIYDGSKAHLDTPHQPITNILHHLSYETDQHHPARFIFVTGRDEEHREVTEAWLDFHGFDPDQGLYMRPAGDKRKDSIVKHDLFNQHIRDRYHVQAVFDDRNQVVQMWRAIGLTVLQVADGNF